MAGSRGAPLKPALRRHYEQALDADVSRVCVHDDDAAHRFASSAGAQAATLASRIYFSNGRYAPGTDAGRKLLGHELVHTLQPESLTTLHRTPESDARLLEIEAQLATLVLKDEARADLEHERAELLDESSGEARLLEIEAQLATLVINDEARADLEHERAELLDESSGEAPAVTSSVSADPSPAAQSRSETAGMSAVIGEQAEAFAKAADVTLHREPELNDKPAPVGFRQTYSLETPSEAGLNSTGHMQILRGWYVEQPGGELSPRKNTLGPLTVEMNKVGTWTVYAKIILHPYQIRHPARLGGQPIPTVEDVSVYLGRRQEIATVDEIADEAFKNTDTADYVNYRILLYEERLKRAGGVALDQSNVEGAYITNEGPEARNPAPVTSRVNSYQYAVHPNPDAPADKKPVKYRWWAIPRETDTSHPIALGQRFNGEAAQYLGDGERQSFTRWYEAKVEIVCELINGSDSVVDTAHYQQMFLDEGALEEVMQVARVMEEGAENYKKIWLGLAHGLKAVHLDARRGTSSDLTLFIGPSAANFETTILVDLTPGAERVEYEGSTVEEVIDQFDRGNHYGDGEILISYVSLPKTWRLTTTGESDLFYSARMTGIGGAVLAGLGIAAGFTPAAPVAPYLLAIGIGLGAASGGMSLTDELRKAKPSTTKVAIDFVSIVGSLAAVGGMVQAIRMGSIELAATTTAGKSFSIFTGFEFDAVGGLLLAADTADRIEEIRNSKMSEEERIDAIYGLILQLLQVGGLIVFGAGDTRQARTRVLSIVGEERVARLRPEIVQTLQALDDTALGALKNVPVDEFQAVTDAISKDPRRAAALSKAFGAKFVDEVRANPARSLAHRPKRSWGRGG